MTIVEAVINDGTGGLRLTWYNRPWLVNQIKVGEGISVSGKVDQYLGRLEMKTPEWEPVEVENLHTNRIVPIYPLTANVAQKWIRTLMRQVITYWAPKLTDHLPETIRQAANLPDLGSALLQVHFPDLGRQITSRPAAPGVRRDLLPANRRAATAQGLAVGTGKKIRSGRLLDGDAT